MVLKNRTIQIRLTKEQLECIKHRSAALGFESVSSFLRFLALEREDKTHERIREIHEHVISAASSQLAPSMRVRKFKTNPAVLEHP